MYFYRKKTFNKRVLVIYERGKCFVGIMFFFASLCSKKCNVNEKIDIMMDGIVDNELNGYKCYSSDNANNEGNLRKTFNSMRERRNEEGNDKR